MLRSCYRGVAAACLAAGMCMPALAQTSPGSGGRQFTRAEHLMHHIIASHFGLTHQQVMDLHGRGYSYEDIATAANISARSGRSLSDVIALRDQRMEWPAIASQYGMTEADLNRPFYRYTGPEAIVYEYNFYQVNTGIPAADYERYRRMGYSPRDIAMAYNTAQRTGRQPDEVFAMLDRGMTWQGIAGQYNMAVADIQAPTYRVAGAREQSGMGGQGMGGRSMYATPNTNIDWSRRFELTPVEMKRLRAMGLRDREIWVVANTAAETGRSPDDIAQHIFRGRTAEQIAEEFNLSASRIREPKPEWQTPEWDQAVREGRWYAPRPGMGTGGTGSGQMREGMGGMREGGTGTGGLTSPSGTTPGGTRTGPGGTGTGTPGTGTPGTGGTGTGGTRPGGTGTGTGAGTGAGGTGAGGTGAGGTGTGAGGTSPGGAGAIQP